MSKPFKIAYVIAISMLLFGVVKSTLVNSSFKQVSDHVYASGNIADAEINQVETYIGYLPPVLQTKFTDENWKVYITNDIDNKVVGRTVIEDKIVYIKSGYENQ